MPNARPSQFKKKSSASSDCHRSSFRLAKSTCRTARFGIQYTDATDPSVSITESLARLFQHTPKNASGHTGITHMRNMSGTSKDTAKSGIGEGVTASIVSEGAVANANTMTPLFSPPGTDLRMTWGDACSLGCLPDLNRYFLLVMDKGTEYFVSFPTKTRASPCASQAICHFHWQKDSLFANRWC